MALTSLKLSHIQLVFKQLVLLYSIRHGYFRKLMEATAYPPVTIRTIQPLVAIRFPLLSFKFVIPTEAQAFEWKNE